MPESPLVQKEGRAAHDLESLIAVRAKEKPRPNGIPQRRDREDEEYQSGA